MFSNIKLGIVGAITGLFGLLGLYAKYQARQKEKFKALARTNEEKAQAIEERIKAHEEREKIEQVNASKSESAIDNELQQYYRD